MSRFRLFLACLLLAALPLQGFAAASMLFCGIGQAAAQAGGHARAAHAQQAAHAHAAHAPPGDQHAAADASPHHGHAGANHEVGGDQDESGHSCPVCDACCQGAAVSGFAPLPHTDALHGAGPRQPVVQLSTRTTPVPDKPPRA